MADFTLTGNDVFPAGVLVGVYSGASKASRRGPTGNLITSATATSSGVTFTGLEYSTTYVAAAYDDAAWRYQDFTTEAEPEEVFTAEDIAEVEEEARVYAEQVAAGGLEVDYAEITEIVVLTNPSALTDVPGLTIDVPEGERPVMVEFFAPYISSTTAARIVQVYLSNGTENYLLGSRYYELANETNWICVKKRLNAPDEAASYQIRIAVVGGNTQVGIAAGAADADLAAVPAYLSAVQV